MSKRPMPPFDRQAQEPAGRRGGTSTAIERLLALCASKGAGHVGVQLVRCIAAECDEATLDRILGRFEAKEEARSMSVLPEELVERVCEFAVSEVAEVGPLALASKQLRAVVMSSCVMGELTIRTAKRFAIDEDGEDDEDNEEAKDRASSLLEVYLRQAAEHYPLIGAVDVGSEDFNVSYVGNVHMQIVSSFRSLKRLSLECCVSVADASLLSSLTSLVELDLSYTSISDQSLRAISISLTRLTQLDLTDCDSITAEGFACLSSLTSLEALDVYGTNITDEGLYAISTSLTRLNKLNLESCRSITAEGFACLSSLTSLEELHVYGTNITDEGLNAISTSLTRLTKLSLGRCHSITAEGFACLSSLTSLKKLFVSQTNITEEGLRAVGLLPLLKSLWLYGCKGISEQAVESLSVPNVHRYM